MAFCRYLLRDEPWVLYKLLKVNDITGDFGQI